MQWFDKIVGKIRGYVQSILTPQRVKRAVVNMVLLSAVVLPFAVNVQAAWAAPAAMPMMPADYPDWITSIPFTQLQDLIKEVYDARIWVSAMSFLLAGAAFLVSSVWQAAPQWGKKVMQNVAIGAIVIAAIPWVLDILFP
jgi:hypothetical protein